MGICVSHSTFAPDITEKGAFIFGDNVDTIHMCIYVRLTPQEMRRALPISYKKDDSDNFLLAIFDPLGRDFLSQVNYFDIIDSINYHKMTNLLTTDFTTLQKKYGISRESYENYYDFARQQLT